MLGFHSSWILNSIPGTLADCGTLAECGTLADSVWIWQKMPELWPNFLISKQGLRCHVAELRCHVAELFSSEFESNVAWLSRLLIFLRMFVCPSSLLGLWWSGLGSPLIGFSVDFFPETNCRLCAIVVVVVVAVKLDTFSVYLDILYTRPACKYVLP